MHLSKKSTKQSLVGLKFCPLNKNRTNPQQNRRISSSSFFLTNFPHAISTTSQFISQTVTRFMETNKSKQPAKKKKKTSTNSEPGLDKFHQLTRLTRYTHTHTHTLYFQFITTPPPYTKLTQEQLYRVGDSCLAASRTPSRHILSSRGEHNELRCHLLLIQKRSPALKQSCVEPHKYYHSTHKKNYNNNPGRLTTSTLIRQEHVCLRHRGDILLCSSLNKRRLLSRDAARQLEVCWSERKKNVFYYLC